MSFRTDIKSNHQRIAIKNYKLRILRDLFSSIIIASKSRSMKYIDIIVTETDPQ